MGEVARAEAESYHQPQPDGVRGRVPAAVWETEKPDPWPPDPPVDLRM